MSSDGLPCGSVSKLKSKANADGSNMPRSSECMGQLEIHLAHWLWTCPPRLSPRQHSREGTRPDKLRKFGANSLVPSGRADAKGVDCQPLPMKPPLCSRMTILWPTGPQIARKNALDCRVGEQIKRRSPTRGQLRPSMPVSLWQTSDKDRTWGASQDALRHRAE